MRFGKGRKSWLLRRVPNKLDRPLEVKIRHRLSVLKNDDELFMVKLTSNTPDFFETIFPFEGPELLGNLKGGHWFFCDGFFRHAKDRLTHVDRFLIELIFPTRIRAVPDGVPVFFPRLPPLHGAPTGRAEFLREMHF